MKEKIDKFRGEFRFLSNFWIWPIFYEEFTYLSVEHAYQASKTLSVREKMQILQESSPSGAKKLGRKVTVRKDWDKVKLRIMEELLRQKFMSYNHKLQDRLLETGDAELIEGNNWGDTFWGVCNGKGENHLGKLLMKIRKEILKSKGNI